MGSAPTPSPANQRMHSQRDWRLIVLLCSVVRTAGGFSFNFTYGDWIAPEKLELHGNVSINDIGVILRPQGPHITDPQGSVGWVVFRQPILFLNSSAAAVSFATSFTFQIITTRARLSGDGMAFMIIPHHSKGPPESSAGEFLGLVRRDLPRRHLFAVEFDTFQNPDLNDSSSSHVGIDINSVVSVALNDTGPGTHWPDQNLYANSTFAVWIDYNGSTSVVEVRMVNLRVSSERPEVPILSLNYDLSKILMPYMFVGFSASTSGQQASYVYSWNFSTISSDGLDLVQPSPIVPPARNYRHNGDKWSVGSLIAVVIPSIFFGMLLLASCAWCFMTIQDHRKYHNQAGPRRYVYRELRRATKGFSKRLFLGGGSSGSVYKGYMDVSVDLCPPLTFCRKEHKLVAVKKLVDAPIGRDLEFISEICIISRVEHRNLVKLLGWCHEKGRRLLVYEYMANGSLDMHLFCRTGVHLKWALRFRILKDVAAALEHLHEGWDQCIVHRDVKAGNVMLDEDFNALLGDFGLARLIEHASGSTNMMTAVGTIGYLAPEVPVMGRFTEKADVYSFGVLALEIVSGRRVLDYTLKREEEHLVKWLWQLHESASLMSAVDPKVLNEGLDEETVKCVLHVGLLCCHPLPRSRPSMGEVSEILREVKLLQLPASRPILSYSHELASSPRSFYTSQPHLPSTSSSFSSFSFSEEEYDSDHPPSSSLCSVSIAGCRGMQGG